MISTRPNAAPLCDARHGSYVLSWRLISAFIRARIVESGERRNASREIHRSAATRFPTDLRRAQARGTASGSPVGQGDTKCASATHAAAQDAPRYVGSCSDRDTDPGLGHVAIRAGSEAPTHAGQRKISPARVRTWIRSDVRKHL